jgi:hypothetical protein
MARAIIVIAAVARSTCSNRLAIATTAIAINRAIIAEGSSPTKK